MRHLLERRRKGLTLAQGAFDLAIDLGGVAVTLLLRQRVDGFDDGEPGIQQLGQLFGKEAEVKALAAAPWLAGRLDGQDVELLLQREPPRIVCVRGIDCQRLDDAAPKSTHLELHGPGRFVS